MTARASRLARLAAAAATAAAVTLSALPGSALPGQADSRKIDPRAVPEFAKMRSDANTRVKEIQVRWAGANDRDYTETAKVPGVGTLKLVCKPNNTIVKLRADNRWPETQMWLAKYEWKNGNRVVAVKNARIYKYANANDDGKGGTGRSAHEGLNQYTPVENRSEGGYAYGLISERPGRHKPAGAAALEPVTSFYLTWTWNGFDHPRPYQSCEMRLRMVTHLDEQIGINWHGDADAEGHEVRSTTVPGLGEVRLTCERGRENDQSITLVPEHPGGSVYSETITGEGRVEDHVESGSLDYDDVSGTIGPLEMPRNGMIRLWYTVPDGTGGSVQRAFYLSSYQVTNNAKHPELNLCEVAVGGTANQ